MAQPPCTAGTDFSSRAVMEANGWSFDWDDAYDFAPQPWSTYCAGVPSTSYCGFKYPGDGVVSWTFTGSGTATLDFGRSWNGGHVIARLNGVVLATVNMGASPQCQKVTFSHGDGDVLSIAEEGTSVTNIHSLTLDGCPSASGAQCGQPQVVSVATDSPTQSPTTTAPTTAPTQSPTTAPTTIISTQFFTVPECGSDCAGAFGPGAESEVFYDCWYNCSTATQYTGLQDMRTTAVASLGHYAYMCVRLSQRSVSNKGNSPAPCALCTNSVHLARVDIAPRLIVSVMHPLWDGAAIPPTCQGSASLQIGPVVTIRTAHSSSCANLGRRPCARSG